MATIHIGTAGWQLPWPRTEDDHALARYAQYFNAVEINSTFHRTHRPDTFTRWAGMVPSDFRFAVKMPKTITLKNRLSDIGLAQEFLEGIDGLGNKLGVVLVQLPPSLAWSGVAEDFLRALREVYSGALVVEPRHPTWNSAEVEKVLKETRIGGVAADPPLLSEILEPYGDRSQVYYRLHGAPRMYWSAYEDDQLAAVVGPIRNDLHNDVVVWVMFDNTAAGAAAPNALRLTELLKIRTHVGT